ncbi:serine/threonine-protein kinase [Spirillospora sp. NPDC052269]
MSNRFAPLSADDPAAVAGYPLFARLGAGGMGRVYLSISPGGQPLAIKVVRREYADDEQFRKRFQQEVQAAQRVHSAYTAPLVEAAPDDPVPWLATVYVPGPSLHTAVEEAGPLPEKAVWRLVAGIAEALVGIHAAGVVHRDLKPSNVLLAADRPRVIDFGIARAADATSLTRTGIQVGTPAFMTPEQIRAGAVGPATDVFALGQLAVFAATGRSAFGEGTTEALFFRILNEPPDLDGCPPELAELATRCLAKDPAARPTPEDIVALARPHTDAAETSPWLPPATAALTADYEPPHMDPGARLQTLVPLPRRRAPLVAGAAAVVAFFLLAVVVAFQTGAVGKAARQGPTSSPGPYQPSSAASAAAPSPTPLGYAEEFRNAAFTMPGGDCTSFVHITVSFDRKGPSVGVGGWMHSDFNFDCSSSRPDPRVTFGANDGNAALAGTATDGPGCMAAVRSAPIQPLVPFANLHKGMRFCALYPADNHVVLLKLTSKNDSTNALSWSATAWHTPPGP